MNVDYLRKQELHGSREGPSAAVRPDAVPGVSLFWSKFRSPSNNYIADFQKHLKETGARTRQGAAISLHLLLGVSAEWLQETGGIHDGRNSRVEALFEQARVFAEMHIGGVYSIRMDLDERGSGVVDVYAAPVHDRRGRPKKNGSRGKDVREVSVKSALFGMQTAAGGGKSFAALQTLWAHHAATTMDSRIVRGVPREITGREHLSVSEYRESVEMAVAWKAERDGQRKTILNTLLFIAERDEEALSVSAFQDQRAAELLRDTENLREREDAFDRDRQDFLHHRSLLSMEATRLEEQRSELSKDAAAVIEEARRADVAAREERTVHIERLKKAVAGAEAEKAHALAKLLRANALLRLARQRDTETALASKAVTVKQVQLERRISDVDMRERDLSVEQTKVEARVVVIQRLKIDADIQARALQEQSITQESQSKSLDEKRAFHERDVQAIQDMRRDLEAERGRLVAQAQETENKAREQRRIHLERLSGATAAAKAEKARVMATLQRANALIRLARRRDAENRRASAVLAAQQVQLERGFADVAAREQNLAVEKTKIEARDLVVEGRETEADIRERRLQDQSTILDSQSNRLDERSMTLERDVQAVQDIQRDLETEKIRLVEDMRRADFAAREQRGVHLRRLKKAVAAAQAKKAEALAEIRHAKALATFAKKRDARSRQLLAVHEARTKEFDQAALSLEAAERDLAADRGDLTVRIDRVAKREDDAAGRERDIVRERHDLARAAELAERRRSADHAAAQAKLREAEMAARVAVEVSQVERDKARLLLDRMHAWEAELADRESKSKGIEEENHRYTDEIALQAARLQIRQAAFDADRVVLTNEIRFNQKRTVDLNERAAAVEKVLRHNIAAEVARRRVHEDDRARMIAAEQAAVMTQSDALKEMRRARQAALSMSGKEEELAQGRAELSLDRAAFESDRSLFGKERAVLVQRRANLERRDAALVLAERQVTATNASLMTGVSEIGAGTLRDGRALEGRADLRPAGDILRKIIETLAARTVEFRTTYQRRGDVLAAKAQELETAIEAATTRETRAREIETEYRTAMERFRTELKRLRRIRDLASEIAKFADVAALRTIHRDFTTAIDSLAREFAPRDKEGREI